MSDYNRYMKQELARLQEENKALHEEVLGLRQYIESLHTLVKAVDELDPKSELMALLDRILYNALLVINDADGSLLVLDEETGDLVFVLTHGAIGKDVLLKQRIPAGKGVAGWVAQNRQPTIVNNTAADDRFFAALDQALSYETHSIVAAPIIGGGKVLGVIELLNKHNGMPFNEADQTLLVLLCRFAGEVLDVVLAQEESDASGG
ncbi:MAG: GAF domain-containing protein [Anaerolineae bacterium]|nr:GAF domain-containing protein [Anaerolineae bacterium]